jgi:hypothetical protein
MNAKLDAVLLTYGSSEHTGGLEAIEQRQGVRRVLAADGMPQRGNVWLEHIDIGDRIRVATDNDRSLILLVTIGERRILVPTETEGSSRTLAGNERRGRARRCHRRAPTRREDVVHG